YVGRRATPSVHALSLHDALPIYRVRGPDRGHARGRRGAAAARPAPVGTDPSVRPQPAARARSGRGVTPGARSAVVCPPLTAGPRSEEHTSELQSRERLVCRLLLE